MAHGNTVNHRNNFRIIVHSGSGLWSNINLCRWLGTVNRIIWPALLLVQYRSLGLVAVLWFRFTGWSTWNFMSHEWWSLSRVVGVDDCHKSSVIVIVRSHALWSLPNSGLARLYELASSIPNQTKYSHLNGLHLEVPTMSLGEDQPSFCCWFWCRQKSP